MDNNKPEWEEHLSAPPTDGGGFTPELKRQIAEQSRMRTAARGRPAIPLFRLVSMAAGLALIVALLVGGNVDVGRYFSSGKSTAGISSAGVRLAPGEGGDLAWWRKRQAAALSKEERTLAGAVVSIMTRDIGTFGRKAGIDAFFEPSMPHLKDQLAEYDASSPRLTQAFVLERNEDDQGTVYSVKTVLATAIPDDPAYEGALTIHVSRASGKIDALSAEKVRLKP